MDQIFSDLEQKIEKLFTKDDLAAHNEFLKFAPWGNDNLFLSTSKLLMLIFRIPAHYIDCSSAPAVDINTPILDGMFPLHLAVMTSCINLVTNLVIVSGAKLNVKCDDAHSPFFGMTPLEMALNLMSKLIPWTPQLSLLELLLMFHEEKATLLLRNISILVGKSSGVRDLIYKYSHQGKVIELATLLKLTSYYGNKFSTMYISTTSIPPEHHFGVPMMLRLFVASRISSLIIEGIQLSGTQEDEDCRKKLSKMTTIMKLLESSERGDLARFNKELHVVFSLQERQLTVEDSSSITKGSQDKSWANRYLNTSFFYIEPSLFQPCGILNLLMPPGYNDSFHNYDGLDIRNDWALTETILRELNGRKVEELNLEDACLFRSNLGYRLRAKFKEENTLTALEKKRAGKQTKQKKRLFQNSSSPRSPTSKQTKEKKMLLPNSSSPHSSMSKCTFHTLSMSSAAAGLTTGAPRYTSCTRNSAFEQVVARKLSSLVFAIKKGRA